MSDSKLAEKHCKALAPGAQAVNEADARRLLSELPGWQLQSQRVVKTFTFENYYQTMAFVNALAWISHREDHHPDLEVGYNRCLVAYSTHSVGGLSENDFICAAKAEQLFA